MRHPEQRLLGGLQTLVLAGDPAGPVVVLLHGYGADAWDLLPLADELHAPPGTTWLVPHAPHEVALGPHMSGRAWFPIDVMALQLAMLSGRHRDLSGQAPPQLAASVAQVQAMLDEAGAPLSRTVLAGFSQGAMTATALALHAPVQPAGLAILSGTLLDREAWAQLAPRRRGLPFFQSHGRSDPLLGYAAAEELYSLLTAAGWPGHWVGFDGGHEIPREVLRGLDAYLTTVLDAA
jgi:phospholipase/carboxylesterase